jgi:hypothetical protein
MNPRNSSAIVAGSAVLLVLAGIVWLSSHRPLSYRVGDPYGTQPSGPGLAPPVDHVSPAQAGSPEEAAAARPHGTVPAAIHDRDQAREGGRRPVPLPLDAVIPLTDSNWPNVRVDHALHAPEETAIAIDPTDANQLVAVAQGYGCYYFRSGDAGVTWTEGPINDPHDLGDPSIAVDADGTFYYGYIGTFSHSGIFVARSTDGGASWYQGTPVIEHSSGEPFEDKEWPICDRTNGPYAGRLYIAWTQFDVYGSADPADSTRVLFSHSGDQGASFAPPVRVSDRGGDCIDEDNTVEGAVPSVGPDGTVYLAWAGPRGIEFDRSTDGGLTWGADRIISDLPGGWDFSVPGIFR